MAHAVVEDLESRQQLENKGNRKALINTVMEVLVFKTNINLIRDVLRVRPQLEKCQDIIDWNVDISDSDKVLRIEANYDISDEVKEIICRKGYHCSELI
jgi:hypothetical protein